MITLSANVASAINNEQAIAYILKVYLDSGTKYYSTIPVTLSSVDYIGGYIFTGGFGEIEQSCDLSMGGGGSSTGGFGLILNEQVSSSGLHSLISPFASDIWINRKIDIGIVATDGTATSDIVWLYQGKIDDVAQVTRKTISIEVIEYGETDFIDLPNVLINKTDFPYAPDENIGKSLPILYGDFYTINHTYGASMSRGVQNVCPTICTDSRSPVMCCAGHICHTIDIYCYYSKDPMRNVGILAFETTPGSFTGLCTMDTDDSGLSTATLPYGSVYLFYGTYFERAGYRNSITAWKDTCDGENLDTYVHMTNGDVLVFQLGGLPSGKIATVFTTALNVIAYADPNNLSIKIDPGYYAPNSSTWVSAGVQTTATYVLQAYSVLNGLNTSEAQEYQFGLQANAGDHDFYVENIYFEIYIILEERNLDVPDYRTR